MSKTALKEAAWRSGRLFWKLDDNQVGMYEAFWASWEKNRLHTWNASRQLGKSFLCCVIAVEMALKRPGCQIKYAAPTAKAVRKILRPHFREIFRDCPEDMKPRFHSQDGEYRFPNGSTITVAGCDRDNAEALRGQHAHLAIVDEAGAIDDLEYVVDSILMPQTTNTRGRVLVVSTPAESPGHPFKAYCDKAEEVGTYLERDIYRNPRLTPEEIRELCEAAGGADSTTWKREYLVQHVTDQATAVLPEATRPMLLSRVLAAATYKRPAYFDTYIWVDPGWNPDFTGIVWAIFDFIGARIVVERDFVMRRMDTDVLDGTLRSTTAELWGKTHKPYKCVADVDHRLIADLSKRGWTFVPTAKDNLDEAINKLRLSVTGQHLPIYTLDTCVTTRRQFENATWNKARTKFTRTVRDGHFDVLSACIYGRRNVDEFHNPVPRHVRQIPGLGLEVIDDEVKPKSTRAFRSLFGMK